jgi:hypothetical protein
MPLLTHGSICNPTEAINDYLNSKRTSAKSPHGVYCGEDVGRNKKKFLVGPFLAKWTFFYAATYQRTHCFEVSYSAWISSKKNNFNI